MQKWPWCSFGKLRDVLTEQCDCDHQLIADAGAAIDLEGNPTRPLHGFVRVVDGDMRLATVIAEDDQEFIPNSVLQYVCEALVESGK